MQWDLPGFGEERPGINGILPKAYPRAQDASAFHEGATHTHRHTCKHTSCKDDCLDLGGCCYVTAWLSLGMLYYPLEGNPNATIGEGVAA